MSTRQCAVVGCDRSKVFARGWCAAHWSRWRRTGSTGSAEVWGKERPTCSVDGCDQPHVAHGYCLNHGRHVAKGGHPNHVGASVHHGDANGSWKGSDVGYTGAHERVRRERGSVRVHDCIDCGAPARHWSYNHADPAELTTAEGLPYSGDPNMYDPRCVPCHKRFDIAYLKELAS